MSNDANLGAANGESRPAAPGEVRHFQRYSFRSRARAVIFPAQQDAEPLDCEVMTTDISRGGLSLLHRKQLAPGQQILLVLDSSTRLVEVRWCCKAWAGLYAAGCTFVGLPDQGPIAEVCRELRSNK